MQRMNMLHVEANFINSDNDLVFGIYVFYVLEFSAALWHNSLSQPNISDIVRVQKSAVKVILGGETSTKIIKVYWMGWIYDKYCCFL